MNPRIARAVAAAIAACGVSLPYAQPPAPNAARLPPNLVVEPVASVSRPDPTADAIAQALIADAALQGSKITVQSDEGGLILLTGVTPTWAQMRKAVDLATQHAGQGKVVNAIATEEVVVDLTGLVAPEPEVAAETEPPEPAEATPAALETPRT